MNKGADIIIIGAGVSGLTAAMTLQSQGYEAVVLEQASVVGGRLATHNLQNGIADYGVQFFTSRNLVFQEQVNKWLDSDLVYVWGHEWSDGSVKRMLSDGQPCYAAIGGMYQLANNLSHKITNINLSTTVKSVQWQNNLWKVTDTKDITYLSCVLILTPPVPQSLALLSEIPLDDETYQELERIYYKPCLCGLFVVKGKLRLPLSGAIQDFSRSVEWIADNQQKGISDQVSCITMQLNREYSEKHFNDSDTDILDYLRNELQGFLVGEAVIESELLKKWHYSMPLTTYPFDTLKVDGFPLIFAGDAFGGRGRIEGAYLSGISAGKVAGEMIESSSAKKPQSYHQ